MKIRCAQNIHFFWEGTETGCLSTVLNINFELQNYPFKGLQQKVVLQYNCFPSGVTAFKSYLRMSLFPRKVTAALKIFGNMWKTDAKKKLHKHKLHKHVTYAKNKLHKSSIKVFFFSANSSPLILHSESYSKFQIIWSCKSYIIYCSLKRYTNYTGPLSPPRLLSLISNPGPTLIQS